MELFQFIIDLYRHLGVHVLLINEQAQYHDIDMGFRARMSRQIQERAHESDITDVLQVGIGYFYEDELSMNYSFFHFPEALAEQFHCKVLSIGPILFRQPDQEEFRLLMQNKKISPAYQSDFLEYFNQVPVLTPDLWNSALPFIFERLCGKAVPFTKVTFADEGWAFLAAPGADYSLPPQPDIALQTIEQRYQAEDRLLHAVSAGNLEEATKYLNAFLHFRIAPRTVSRLRDRKNLMITFNTLMRKAAQVGGVHPLHIDNLSRQFAIQIEALSTLEQANGIEMAMVRKYCLLIRNYARHRYSPLVQTCMDRIDFYYNTELSLAWLAKQCSVSESHLSTLFKRETGITITDYINTTRIQQSLILLNTTSLPIGEISSRCGFFDANYFTRVFKKFQGQTPQQYRKMVQGR